MVVVELDTATANTNYQLDFCSKISQAANKNTWLVNWEIEVFLMQVAYPYSVLSNKVPV